MTRLFTTGLTLLALVSVIAVDTTPANAARDKNGFGGVIIEPDGSGVVMLNASVCGHGKSFVYVEFQLVPLEDLDVELQEEPGPDTLFGVGVVAIQAATGDFNVGVVLLRLEPDGSADFDFRWRDSVTLADGTVVSRTGRLTKFPKQASVSLTLDDSGKATAIFSRAKLIIMLP